MITFLHTLDSGCMKFDRGFGPMVQHGVLADVTIHAPHLLHTTSFCFQITSPLVCLQSKADQVWFLHVLPFKKASDSKIRFESIDLCHKSPKKSNHLRGNTAKMMLAWSKAWPYGDQFPGWAQEIAGIQPVVKLEGDWLKEKHLFF